MVQVQGYRWGAGAARLAEGAGAPGAVLHADDSRTLMWCRCKAIGGEQVLRAWLKEQEHLVQCFMLMTLTHLCGAGARLSVGSRYCAPG